MSATQRRKGATAELEVCHLLHAEGWPTARRTHDGREQSLRGDIANGPQGVHLEIKRQERLNVPAAIRQAIADANPLDIPIVVHRPSRSEWFATLPFTELLALLKHREQA